MRTPVVENCLFVQNALGESPLWHPVERALYWVDIAEQPAIYRWQPETRCLQKFPVPLLVSAIGWRREGGGFIAATRSGIGTWHHTTGLTLGVDPEPDDPETRLNDAAVDRQGRFWVGSMKRNATTSRLFRFDRTGGLHQMDQGFTVANGIGWSPDGGTMYVTDSHQHAIFAYDFCADSGHISARRKWIDTTGETGVPDGLTVDEQGGIWSAFCRGGRVVRYTPEGRKDVQIHMPVTCPTSCAFGGEHLDTLYITSSRQLLAEKDRASQPLAGNLFCVQPGVQGLPEPAFQ